MLCGLCSYIDLRLYFCSNQQHCNSASYEWQKINKLISWQKMYKYVLFIEVGGLTRSWKLTANLRLFKLNWYVLRSIYRNGSISLSGEKQDSTWVRYGKPKTVKSTQVFGSNTVLNILKLHKCWNCKGKVSKIDQNCLASINVSLCFYLLSCNFIKGKNKAVNCTVPCGCQHLRPWSSDAECVMHFQNRDPDMNTKLDNDTANTLSSKLCWRLTAAPS